VLLFAGCFLVSGAYAREQGRAKARSGSKTVGLAHPPKREGGRASIAGRVVYVNAVAETITVRTGANTVTFDASNPALSGFRSLAEIRTGDWVAVSYTDRGIAIQKGRRRANVPARTSGSPFVLDEGPAKKQKQKQARATALPRRQPRQKGESFDDIDVNKDGKITPVELSTLIRNITMEMFRQYDRDGDGFIDRTEFMDAARQQRKAPAR
jgi:hypothetical protein